MRVNGGWQVELDNGAVIQADALALAVGNQEPEGLSALHWRGSRFIANPWGADARAAVAGLAKAAIAPCWSGPASPWSISSCRSTRRAIPARSSLCPGAA